MSDSFDSRVRRFLKPLRVLWHSSAVRDADNLLVNNWGQALAQNVASCALEGEGAALLLDFGREMHGGVQIVVGPLKDNRAVRARLRFGESASEAMGEPNNDHAPHDFPILLSPMSSSEFGQTGFRFVRLDLLDAATVPLASIRAVTLEHEPELLGSFECSDARLNEIWRVGKETVRLCLQDYIWDGIKRDRLVWLGDLHPEISVVLRCFGALDIVPRSLDWVRDHTPLPEWMNGIGSYSLWWILLQRDWFRFTGDLAYLEAQRAYLSGLLPVILDQIQPDGTVAWRGWQFLDWPSSPNPTAVSSGLHALLKMALDAGGELFESLQDDEWTRKCRVAAEKLAHLAPPLPASQGAAIAGNKQAAALLALAELADAKTANAQVLSIEPLQGISTFYGYYVLEARAQADDMSGALEVIRNYWGAMLDLGATSFWEDFDLSWMENAGRIDEVPTPEKRDVHRERGNYCYQGLRHSLCHGWAAGPTAFLSARVLGFEAVEPGCAMVRVRPDLGDLEWASGSFPTPRGVILVHHQKTARGEIVSRIEAPDGVTIIK